MLMHSALSVTLENRDNLIINYAPSKMNSRIRIRHNGGYEVTFIPKNADLPETFLLMNITEDSQAVTLQLGIKNTTGRPLKVREFNLLAVNCLMAGRVVPHISLENMVFYGYRALQNDPFPHWIEPERALYGNQHYHGNSVAVLADKTDKSALVLGFTTANSWAGKISMRLKDLSFGIQRLRAMNILEGVRINPGECIKSELLTIEYARDARDGLEKWASRTAKNMGVKPYPNVPTGWATWDYYHCDINEKNILENVRFLARNSDRFPVKYIQIDDGYCLYGDWLDWDKKRFPHGPAWLADKIKSYGFSPAIWYIPTVIASNSKFIKKHPNYMDWVFKDDRGAPVKKEKQGGFSTARSYYFLDGSLPEVQSMIRATAATLTKEFGFEYVKTDGATDWVLTGGRTRNDRVGLHKAYKIIRSCVREGTGDAFLLACLYDPSFTGLIDGLRIGPDIRAIWDINYWPQRYPEYSPGAMLYMENVLGNMLNTWFTHGRLWLNDPDYLVIRSGGGWKNPGKVRFFSADEARLWATLVSLNAGVVILGDRMTNLTEERKTILEKVLPVFKTQIRPVDFLDRKIPSVIIAEGFNQTHRWHVLTFINYTGKIRVIEAPLNKIGMSGPLHMFDFWKKSYVAQEGLIIKSGQLPPHSVQCLAFRKRQNHPQIVGSDIHIMQGAVEVISERWNQRENTLTIMLNPEHKRRGALFVFVPGRFACISKTRQCKRYEYGSVKSIAVDTRKTPKIVLRFNAAM